jgi:hypothetical protein
VVYLGETSTHICNLFVGLWVDIKRGLGRLWWACPKWPDSKSNFLDKQACHPTTSYGDDHTTTIYLRARLTSSGGNTSQWDWNPQSAHVLRATHVRLQAKQSSNTPIEAKMYSSYSFTTSGLDGSGQRQAPAAV